MLSEVVTYAENQCRIHPVYEASVRSGYGASAVTHAERTKSVVTAVSAVGACGPADWQRWRAIYQISGVGV